MLKNPGGQIGAKTGSAALSKNPKAALSTIPDLFIFLSDQQRPLSGKICAYMNVESNFEITQRSS